MAVRVFVVFAHHIEGTRKSIEVSRRSSPRTFLWMGRTRWFAMSLQKKQLLHDHRYFYNFSNETRQTTSGDVGTRIESIRRDIHHLEGAYCSGNLPEEDGRQHRKKLRVAWLPTKKANSYSDTWPGNAKRSIIIGKRTPLWWKKSLTFSSGLNPADRRAASTSLRKTQRALPLRLLSSLSMEHSYVDILLQCEELM